MRKWYFVCGLVIVVLLNGCSLLNSPKAALNNFSKAVEKNDMKALAKVATPETVQLIATFGSKAQGYAASMVAEKGKVTKVSEKIEGDEAIVTVTYANGDTESYDLVKVDGKWKVHMSMDLGK